MKKWNFSYKNIGKQEVKQNILDTISLWVAIGLLWYAFLSIIGEHFPEFLPVDARVVIPFVVVFWIGYEWPEKYFPKAGFLCRVAGLTFPVLYVLLHLEKVLDGVIRLAWFYLPYFNAYYDSNFYLGIAREEGNSVFAFTALCMLFWGLSWTIAYGWKKRVLLVLFPLMALIIELVVGLSPFENGLFLAFFAAILLLTMGSASVLRKMVAIACAGIVLLLPGKLFDENLREVNLHKQKKDLLEWQNSINLENINLASLFKFDFHYNWEQLNNGAPQYTGKTILEIVTDKQRGGNFYLKGFYATNYEDGDWEFDDSLFQEACRKAGKSPEEVAKQILQMPYERVKEAYGDILDEMVVDYQISYVGTTGNVAYAPYLSDYDSLDDAYEIVGDYLLKKSILDGNTSGKLYEGGFQYVGMWNVINTAIEAGFGNYVYPEYEDGVVVDLNQQKEELEFLNSLSEAYLQLPEDTEYLAAAIEKIESAMSTYTASSYYGIGLENENMRRILCANEVAKYLDDQMSYSLKLDALPEGVDPIEYALTVSHEGYCMHFASAATLILRELGIPARYVSGYTVSPSAFEKDAETGMYHAAVGDFMAHAWVEIYLDNIGWTILEVTPGSSLENLPSQDDIDRWESLSEIKRPKDEPQSENSETEESENSETATEETEETQSTQPELNNSQDSQQETPSQSEEEETGNQNGIGTGENQASLEMLLKAFGMIVAGVLLVLAVAGVIMYGTKRYQNALLQEIDKQMTKKAVKRINRRMYYMLIICNPKLWFAGKMTDIMYEEALIEYYPVVSAEHWERFMDIVKKNHYSKEKPTVEEMQFCYDCYLTCVQKKNKR